MPATDQRVLYGLYSYGLYSYGLYSYGLDSYGLYSYGLGSYGLYSYGLCGYGPLCGLYTYAQPERAGRFQARPRQRRAGSQCSYGLYSYGIGSYVLGSYGNAAQVPQSFVCGVLHATIAYNIHATLMQHTCNVQTSPTSARP